ncbi:MAG: CvpA family protein [Alphaproteobacteria bacterium]|nr:CvpA family protein [Alphaproteobacteria bacterium]
MEQLNNLDVFFLIIVGISALVGIARGFTKEALSLLGWVVAGMSVYFLTPVANSIMKNYIASEMLSNIVSGLLVLLVVCVFWVLAVDKIATSIRQSKLSPLDRIFGLGFGVLRGALVVVLLVMMVSALIPEDAKKGLFAESKIFVASEEFIEPIKSLIPEETLNSMQAQMEKLGFGGKKVEEEAKDDAENGAEKAEPDEKKADEQNEEPAKKDEPKKKENKKAENSDKPLPENAKDAFMELAQPKIEGVEDAKEAKESFDEMSEDLQKLMDAITDQTVETSDDDFGL